ncbi:alpha/beta hydrolase [Polaribacter sp. SA4-12]|uniref:alpha/beta hydrolase n=1 Tax=Polaribacter sp. SA4-12 TaxID=1312072 RepID=UPI000B3C0B94|nr:alpha/beta hydrolase [Polaribacter sp. SA4-12]ARV16599.1 esterase [Polaribacter sp. SA4-12]
MRKSLILIFCFVLTTQISFSQNETVLLWKTVPNQIESSDKEIVITTNITRISNVQNPSFDVFIAPKQLANKKAVLILPGGGYGVLAYDYEGLDFAKWFNSIGVTAFVLKYRLPNSKSIIKPHLAPLQDAQRAIRLIRNDSKKYNIDPTKIGVIGFSAGGHLASTLGTKFNFKSYEAKDIIDTLSAKPNFMALIYPVISMKKNSTHKGSRFNLLGKKPSEKLVNLFSNELQVSKETPSTFIIHCTDDNAVPIENSLLFYQALKSKNIPTEFHIYPKGGHGFGFGKSNKNIGNWTQLLKKWILK